MTMKSLILGSAALLAATGAQAADLGAPAPAAVDYVRICDAYGAGFFYIPGGDVCMRISGYVRAEYRVGDTDFAARRELFGENRNRLVGLPIGPLGWDFRFQNGTYSRVRALLDIDTRVATEFGLLRSMIEVYWTLDTSPTGTSPFPGAVDTDLDLAFIQWGGLTAGRAQSFFDFYTGMTAESVFVGTTADTKTTLLAYTFAFGNGVSATLSIEDPTTQPDRFRRNGVTFGDEAVVIDDGLARRGAIYGGLRAPDIVANINITQAWGGAQIMAAARQNFDLGAAAITTGRRVIPDDEWGWAVGAGVRVNLPMLGAGDQFAIQGAYSEGAIQYAIAGAFRGTNLAQRFSNLNVTGAGNYANLGADYLVSRDGRRILQTEAWGVGAGFKHNFSPRWEVNLEAGYGEVDAAGPRDFGQWDIQGDVRFKPLAGFLIGAAVEYRNVDFTSRTVNAFSGNDPGVDLRRLRDSDAWVGLLRLQRNF